MRWQVLGLQIGRVRPMDDFQLPGQTPRAWQSATCKAAAEGAVRVGPQGLLGDEQSDRAHHGGPDKACLFYAAGHYGRWREELRGIDFPFGGFGENVTIDCDEQTVCIGDRLRAGDVLLEISQPRVPCWKQAWRWGVPDLDARMKQTGRTGWYARVLQPGELRAGDTVTLVARPYPETTIGLLNRALYVGASAAQLRELARCPAIAADLRATLERKAASRETS